MKRAVILHGTDGSPEINWFPWMKSQLEARGYEVWAPQLPNCHTPNRVTYNDFLFGSGWDFTDNLLIGHSSGAVSVLNLLQDDRCPHIATAVMVGVWARADGLTNGTAEEADQFKDLFPPEGFDFAKIKGKSDQFLYLHGSDDPYCPLDQARWIAEQTGGDFVEIPNGHHLGGRYKELPELLNALKAR